MKQKSYGGIVVILFICILAFGCGAIGGMLHLGEDYCKDFMPLSLSTPVDTVSVIDEQDFESKNITVQLYVPKPVVTTTTIKNYTNNTYNKTNTSTNNSSYNNSRNTNI